MLPDGTREGARLWAGACRVVAIAAGNAQCVTGRSEVGQAGQAGTAGIVRELNSSPRTVVPKRRKSATSKGRPRSESGAFVKEEFRKATLSIERVCVHIY